MNYINLKNYISLENSTINDKDIKKLAEIENIENIQKILINYKNLENDDDINRLILIKIYYLYREIIHSNLYENEEMIYLNFDDKKEDLSYYFYLSLLIRNNDNIINY